MDNLKFLEEMNFKFYLNNKYNLLFAKFSYSYE